MKNLTYIFNYWIRIIAIVLLMLSCGKWLGFEGKMSNSLTDQEISPEGLKPVMVDQLMFHDVCHYNNRSIPFPKNETCDEQLLKLDNIYQISLSLFGPFLFLIGLVIDFLYSKKLVLLLYYPVALLSCGCVVLFGFSVFYRVFDKYYFVSIISFLGMNGFDFSLWLVFLKVGMDVPKQYSSFASITNGLTNASFNLSILVFYIFSEIYFNLKNKSDGVIIFCVYAGVNCFFFLIFGVFLEIPKKCKPPPAAIKEIEVVEEEKKLLSITSVDSELKRVPTKPMTPSFWNEVLDFFKIVFSVRDILLLIWFSFAMLQLNFYVSTVYNQAYFLAKSDKLEVAKYYSDVFSIVWPTTACVFSIIFSVVAIYFRFSVVLLGILNVIWTILSVIPVLQIHYSLFFMESISNCFTYILLYEAIVRFFGMKWFSTLSALQYTIGGFVTLLTMLMNTAAMKWYKSFVISNAILGAIGMCVHVVFIFLVFIGLRKTKGKEQEENETPGESQKDEN